MSKVVCFQVSIENRTDVAEDLRRVETKGLAMGSFQQTRRSGLLKSSDEQPRDACEEAVSAKYPISTM